MDPPRLSDIAAKLPVYCLDTNRVVAQDFSMWAAGASHPSCSGAGQSSRTHRVSMETDRTALLCRRGEASDSPAATEPIIVTTEHGSYRVVGDLSIYNIEGTLLRYTGTFEATIRADDRLGARPLLARTRFEYARMLLSRGRPGDETRALELLDRAHAAARTLGMAAVVGGIEALRGLRRAPPPPRRR